MSKTTGQIIAELAQDLELARIQNARLLAMLERVTEQLSEWSIYQDDVCEVERCGFCQHETIDPHAPTCIVSESRKLQAEVKPMPAPPAKEM